MRKLNLFVLKILACLSLYLLLCFLCVCPCFAETTYTITETEIQQLKSNFNTLEQLNNKSQQELILSNNRLQESEKKLLQQEKKLTALTETSKMQEQSLKIANEFCDKLNNDLSLANKKVHKYIRQRNIYAGLFVSAITAYFIEKER